MLIKAKTDILGHKISRQQDMGQTVKKLEKTGNFALFGGIDFKQIIRYDLCHKVGENPNSAQKVGESGKFPGTNERRAQVNRGFTGEYHHSLDAKGRLIVPARFRDLLGSTFRIGVSLDNCLTVYSDEGWESFYEKLSALPQNRPDTRKLVRYFTSGTFDVEVDRQGRILLPQKAREKVGIDKDVVWIGCGTKAEIWSEEAYGDYMNEDSREEISAIAANLLDEHFVI